MRTRKIEPKVYNFWDWIDSVEWDHIKRTARLELININITTTLSTDEKNKLARLLREEGFYGEADVIENAVQEIAQ